MTWLARARLALWVVVVAVMAWSVWSLRDAQADLRGVVVDLQEARQVDRARACVTSWEGRTGVRELIDGLITAGGGTDSTRAEQFRDDMNERLPDPDCDLDAAERRVARADR